jgi:dTDP-4-dehydrorhamnose 3,5-epimerase
MMKVVLFDGRKESGTYGEVNEFFAGEYNPILIHIPPYVYHGFKCISEEEAIVVNTPTEVYRYEEPDEYRVHPYETTSPMTGVEKMVDRTMTRICLFIRCSLKEILF